jgi:hypothetical protein
MFILDMPELANKPDGEFDRQLIQDRWDKYGQYLESLRGRIPEAAFSFAIAEWHYNFRDPRCPHDSWVEKLTIREPSSGKRRHIRGLEIRVRLLGAYHDGYIELFYKNVAGYSLAFSPGIYGWAHSDWLYDEVRISDEGSVIHEIRFASNARWYIECEDIVYEWEPFKQKLAATSTSQQE